MSVQPHIKGPQIKGWCPGALTPMQSGDGLVVRVRPFNGRLRRAQADGLASLAAAHGNGLLDLSSRGNIQLRGVSEDSYPAVLEGLQSLALLDPAPEVEARRNLLVTPFWQAGDETERLSAQLTDALMAPEAPQVPHKFGFAVDTGETPVLQTASADIRLERNAEGGLLLVADGSATGKAVTVETIVKEAMELAHWFLATCHGKTRMRVLLAADASMPPGHTEQRQQQIHVPMPGRVAEGTLVGLAFGQLQIDTLASLAKQGGLRMTPWRMLLVENAKGIAGIEGLITDPADPLLQVIACTGAPRCTQGHIETRALARQLAGHASTGQKFHISGCTKGCAHPKPAAITITGTPHGLNLIHNGHAADTPTQSGLTADQLIKAI